jgi:Protein of unknown function (DUF3131)
MDGARIEMRFRIPILICLSFAAVLIGGCRRVNVPEESLVSTCSRVPPLELPYIPLIHNADTRAPEGDPCGCCDKGWEAVTVATQKEDHDRSIRRVFRHGPLTEREQKVAENAWNYFKNNYQEKTGLTNAVNEYPSTTMWDLASTFGAWTAAEQLGLMPKEEFNRKMVDAMKTLNTMQFFKDELPNKVYNAANSEKVDYANKPGEIGFSALDLGRMLIWLKIIREQYPEHSNAIDNFVLRWNFCNCVDDKGVLYGAIVDKEKKTKYVQEGRLGYEEYAAKGFQLWGFDTQGASRADPYDLIRIYNVEIPYDKRDPRTLKAHNYVVSESYVLDGIEFGWDMANDSTSPDSISTDEVTEKFGHQIYMAQVARYDATGILTARSEHQLDKPPYFVYDTIYTDGYAWNTISEDGKNQSQFAAISLKAALGMWAVWDSEYTDRLFDAIAELYDPKKGYYEGLYENGKGTINSFTANNNGIMLAALMFKKNGKILKHRKKDPGLWERVISDPYLYESYNGKQKCLPKTFDACTTCNKQATLK